MINIESNQYRITRKNGVTLLTCKKTGQTKTLAYIPNATHLTGITEKQFDQEMASKFYDPTNS